MKNVTFMLGIAISSTGMVGVDLNTMAIIANIVRSTMRRYIASERNALLIHTLIFALTRSPLIAITRASSSLIIADAFTLITTKIHHTIRVSLAKQGNALVSNTLF